MQCQQCVGSVLAFVRFYGANIESCFISCKFFAIFFDISLDYVTFMGTVWPRGGRQKNIRYNFVLAANAGDIRT